MVSKRAEGRNETEHLAAPGGPGHPLKRPADFRSR